MKTEIGGPEYLTVTAAAAYTVGVGTLVGTSIFGVPQASAASGAVCTLKVQGQVTLAKTASLAVAIGDALYWDDTNKVVNKTSASQREIGWAISATGSGAGEVLVDVYLVPAVRTSVAA